MARTAAQIQSDIDNIYLALNAIVVAGASYTINTGGSTRTVTMADGDWLESRLITLQKELDALTNVHSASTIRAGW